MFAQAGVDGQKSNGQNESTQIEVLIPEKKNSKSTTHQTHNWTCAICLYSHEETSKCEHLPCSHWFHYNCLTKLIKFKLKEGPISLFECPVCREKFRVSLVKKKRGFPTEEARC